MKVPLRFQITEFDCGTVALLNAFSFLFDREELPAELVRSISLYTLDCYGEDGNMGDGGTSREAINMLTSWITHYAKSKNFGVDCERFVKDDVDVNLIRKCIEKKGVVYLRTYQDCEHYVIVTDIDDEYVYIFDPYYLDETYYDDSKEVKIIFDKPFDYNRIVKLSRLNNHQQKDFALGPIEKRECVLITRTNKKH